MKRSIIKAVLLGAGLTMAAAGALAQGKVDLGKREYDANCASCHGLKGTGDGPVTPYLNRSPTDLTKLARANGGVLPVSRLYESIDGTLAVPGHGSRDMPTWGDTYRARAAEYYIDVPYDPNAFVRARILALIEYISRLQAK
jgi:mono/diheme cytochrome c family protein